KYTILDQAPPESTVTPVRDGNSVAEGSQRDLDAALQLLAERAQYLTGASGASVALREDGEMVCRASAGRAAPELGVEIEADSGLIAESIRMRQLVRCNEADRNPRANRESCEQLGVKSVMVMPLLREQEVVGVFELVADRASAFEERDAAALTRLAEMALTAVEHAEAAQRALPEIAEAQSVEALSEEAAETVELAKPSEADQELPSSTVEPLVAVPAEIAKIGSCEACGFPVSQGRALCVDCEQAGRSAEPTPLGALVQEETWLQAHSYTIGTLAIAALTLALLALKMR
ncbi:MAG: GAF domain-containing protein, partial [Terriglobales bacterium]